MKKPDLESPCLCQSGKLFQDCCHPFLTGEQEAPTPELLMRSRYTAFCIGDASYLTKTWHPETLPEGLEDGEPNNWIRLEIMESSFDDAENEGEVEFKASLLHKGKLEVLHENSDFVKLDGKWVYHSGEFLEGCAEGVKIKNSAPCPCGSGKLFKNCHK